MNKFFLVLASFLTLGVENTAPAFQADVENYIQDEVEPLARRHLVAYQFGKPLYLDTNRGTSYTASRYQRLPLPYAPLQEGVAPTGESLQLFQVSATAQQWGDCVKITDVANLTIKHPLFQQAIQLLSLQMPEMWRSFIRWWCRTCARMRRSIPPGRFPTSIGCTTTILAITAACAIARAT